MADLQLPAPAHTILNRPAAPRQEPICGSLEAEFGASLRPKATRTGVSWLGSYPRIQAPLRKPTLRSSGSVPGGGSEGWGGRFSSMPAAGSRRPV